MAGQNESHVSARELRGVSGALRNAGVEVAGPLTAESIANGRSNLTCRITDGSAEWVLRMPPRAGRTPSAHDVVREYTVVAALAGTAVPVPRAVMVVEDESVIGSQFTVTEFVHGASIQTHDDLAPLPDDVLAAVGEELLSTLAALHGVDYRAIGLEGFGRPNGYLQRQVHRWTAQWSLVGDPRLGELASEVSTRLAGQLSDQGPVVLVHGDYRLDNTLIDLGAPGRPSVTAVVDWELSTLGDPVADVATMCAYRHPALDLIHGRPSAWTSERLPDADALAAAYVRAGGAALDRWDLQLGLAYFKIGVIAAGINHRLLAAAGADLGVGLGSDTAGDAVETYLELARERVGADR